MLLWQHLLLRSDAVNRHFATVGLVAVLLVFGSVAAGLAEQTQRKSSPFTRTFRVNKANLVTVA
jgi:hypothetical protein